MDKELLITRIEALCKMRKIKLNTAFTESKVGKNFKANLATSNPSIGKLTLLANYFGVPVEYLTGEIDSFPGCTDDVVSSLSLDEQNILVLYRSLNEEGKEKAADYLDDLVQSGKYIKSGTLLVDKKEA